MSSWSGLPEQADSDQELHARKNEILLFEITLYIDINYFRAINGVPGRTTLYGDVHP